MAEIEGKILDVDPEAVAAKFAALGAKKVFDAEMEARFYHDADDVRIRLRNEGGTWVLCAKRKAAGGAEGVKSQEEYETQVSDPEAAAAILGVAGFREVARVTKRRTSWEIGETRFELDRYRNLPPHLEIEAPDAEAVARGAELLGFRREDLKDWSLRELEAHYGRKAG